MSWILPSALVAGAVAAIAAVAIHFITRSRPLAEPLPTARFIPSRAVRARVTALGFSDRLLLLLRILAIAAIAIGVAAPEFAAAHGRVARIILVDRSRGVGDSSAAADSVRTLARSGDVVIAFDSAARTDNGAAARGVRGSLSAGLAAAIRAASSLPSRADSVDLILVSPFLNEEIDSATARLRAAWPGRVRLVRTPAASVSAVARGVVMRAGPDDPLRAGLALMGAIRDTGSVRIERGHVAAADSAWARGAGHVLVHWPATGGDAHWPARATIDAIGGVAAANGAALVGRFPRAWRPPGRAVAWWADGEIAAGESSVGDGCIRDVGILIDPASDLTLRPSFRRFAAAMLAPCGGTRDLSPIDSATLRTLAGTGPLAPASAFASRADVSSSWSPWLLTLGALLLILELAARRTARSARR